MSDATKQAHGMDQWRRQQIEGMRNMTPEEMARSAEWMRDMTPEEKAERSFRHAMGAMNAVRFAPEPVAPAPLTRWQRLREWARCVIGEGA